MLHDQIIQSAAESGDLPRGLNGRAVHSKNVTSLQVKLELQMVVYVCSMYVRMCIVDVQDIFESL